MKTQHLKLTTAQTLPTSLCRQYSVKYSQFYDINKTHDDAVTYVVAVGHET